MTGVEADIALIEGLMAFANTRHSKVIADRAGVDPGTLQKKLTGQDHNRLSQRTLEKLQAAYPGFPGWTETKVGEGRLPYKSEPVAMDMLSIPMLELGYGMGGTFLDAVEPGEVMRQFPRDFIRMLTSAPASQLCWSHGIGDSMDPTIGDRDVILIDLSRDAIRMNDQIWALAVSGIGMVKRVRIEPGGQIVLKSDNAKVADYPVGEDELTVIGRVIAVVRRI